MTNSVLITGATGLIGQHLTEVLLQKGCRVSHLSRNDRKSAIPTFRWNPDEGVMDERALEGVDTVINLAGAGMADKRWSASRKNEILNSRVNATALLAKALSARRHSVSTVIQASAIGYYGPGDSTAVFREEHGPGKDFMASVVVQWEHAAEGIERLGIRLVTIRIGIVLSGRGGALKELTWPVRWGVGAPLGNGQQGMSWIHIDDLTELFAMAIESGSIQGPINAVSPNPVTNREFTQALARQLRRPLWLPPVPAFVLRLLVGEMADMVIHGNYVSCDKILGQGFQFRFPLVQDALMNLLPR